MPCAGLRGSHLRLLSSFLSRGAGGRASQRPSHITALCCPHPKSLRRNPYDEILQLVLRPEGVCSNRLLWFLKRGARQCPMKVQRVRRVGVFRPTCGKRAHGCPETFLCTSPDPLTLLQLCSRLFQLCSRLAPLLALNSPYRLLSQDLCTCVPDRYARLPPRFSLCLCKCHLIGEAFSDSLVQTANSAAPATLPLPVPPSLAAPPQYV